MRFRNLSLAQVFFVLSISLTAQNASNPVDAGLQIYHDYHGGDIDHINLDNGGLTVNIPLLSYPQRGSSLKADFQLLFTAGTNAYQEYCLPPIRGQQQCIWSWMGTGLTIHHFNSPFYGTGITDMQDLALGVKQLTNPGPPISYEYQVSWETPDQAIHLGGQNNSNSGQTSLDGSNIQNGELYPSFTCAWGCSMDTIGTKDGVTYSDGNTAAPSGNGGILREDTDGNYISMTSGGYYDTVGRFIPIPSSYSGSSTPCTGTLPIVSMTEWTPPGYSQPFLLCYAQITLTESEEHYGSYEVLNPTKTVLQSVVLPNGQAWTFGYNESLPSCSGPNSVQGVGGTINIGDLTDITFPTGGTIHYTYACYSPVGGSPTVTTAVTSRTVNANDGTGAHEWTYSYALSGNSWTGTTTMTDPIGNQTVQVLNSPTRTITKYSGSASGGTVMQTSLRTYLGNYVFYHSFPLYAASETITLDNGLSSETTYSYCCDFSFTNWTAFGGSYPNSASYGKVTDTKVYDYASGGLGTLLKETATSYLFQSNSNYIDPGLVDLVSSQTIYNGSGSQMAQTTYGYDQTSRVTSGIVGMTGAQITTPLYSGIYGHQTSKTQWLNTGSNPTTNVSFYDTGEAYQVSDPLGHTSSTYFCTGSSPTTLPCTASTYLGALPTATANALNQQTAFTYNATTGEKLTVTDPNSQTTTYTYSDYLNRLTSISYPDGGLTGIQYNDTGNIGITVTDKITGTLNKQTQEIVDGLGRLSETILLSDPSGHTYTLTTYDALGRKYQVYNPTRCNLITTNCGESTWGVTTYNYDALNRELLEIPPDGSSTSDNINTSYSGNTTTVTDEAGKYRTTTKDALGRLTQVSEGSAGYITLYSWDSLSNLLCVEQHGGVSGTGCSSSPSNDASSAWHVRRFTYDSLSRLLTAKNPETGTITYGYDLDSVLTSKMDNRGITITYSPDALYRISSKSYSDSEPTISYTYDAFTSGSNYGVGRRTGMTDGSGSASWTYDTMGREWSETKAIGSITKTNSTVYNYDGSPSQVTYPPETSAQNAPKIDLAYTMQGAGLVSSVTDNTNNINYTQGLLYAPTGQSSIAVYGYSSGYAGITQTNTYNSRGQPIELRACGLSSCTDGSGSQTPYLLDLSYNYGLGSNDNGNVLGITNNKNTARNQSFSYDVLNRVTQASSGTAWGSTFTYDPWGNLYQTGSVAGTSINPMTVNQQMTLTTNQFALLGYVFDASGNVLADGINTGCGSYAYTWNAEEQMSCAAGSTYTYDGDGARVEKTGGNAVTTLYWSTLAESGTNGTITSEYIFAGSKRIARRDVSTGSVYYYFDDMLGSSSVVSTSSGALENESDFYPFGGENVVALNLTNQKFKFTGKERDTETGLDDFGARYYNYNMGRFQSPDWANKAEPVPYSRLDNPQTLNLYAYVENNPESAPDLDGHDDGGGETQVQQFNDAFDAAMGGACASGIMTACGSAGPSSSAAPQTKDGQHAQSQVSSQDQQPAAQPQSNTMTKQYDPTKQGPEDPTHPGHPLYENRDFIKEANKAFVKTSNGTARGGVAEAGFAIEYDPVKNKLSFTGHVDNVHTDGPANELTITGGPNTICVFHTHGNTASMLPSGMDRQSSVPNFVYSSRGLYVTIPKSREVIPLSNSLLR